MSVCRASSVPGRFQAALHVFVLSSFAIAGPVYDRLGHRASFLIDKGIRLPAVLLLVAAVSVGIPAAIVLATWVAGLWRKSAADALQAVSVFALSVLILMPVVKRAVFLQGWVVLLAACVIAAAAASAYFRYRRVRTAILLAAPGLLVFPASLLFYSSVSGLIFPPQGPRVGKWRPIPVVVVVFDELCGASLTTPDRQIDAERFPNFARLAAGSTWFRNASTVHPDTEQAVPAILTGKYPSTPWTPTPADLPQNLFSVLDMACGYDLAVFEPVSNLAPFRRDATDLERPGICSQTATLARVLAPVYLFHIAPEDCLRLLPEIPRSWFNVRDSKVIDPQKTRGVFRYGWEERRDRQFEHFLNCLQDSSRPTLHFIHVLLPHIPWAYLPSGRRYADDRDTVDLMSFDSHSGLLEYWGQDEWLVSQSRERYCLQLEYVDQLVGRLLARLKESGLYDRSLLVLTADHGVSFHSNQPRREPASGNLADILSIPLFIKLPEQTAGEISDRNVESIDIFPSIADVLGIALSDPVDGCSVFDRDAGERELKRLGGVRSWKTFDPAVLAQSDPASFRPDFERRSAPAQIGPAAGVVGRAVDEFELSKTAPLEIEFVRYADELTNAHDALCPCLFEGYVRAPKPIDAPVVLAVAVNGRIRAVTRTLLLDPFRDRWAALVPESAIRAGPNRIEVFGIVGSDSHAQLLPCRVVRKRG